MNKLEVMNVLHTGNHLTTNPAKVALIKQMLDVKHSHFLGELETYRNQNYPALVPEDISKIKPFFGFINIGLDDKNGIEVEHRQNAMLVLVKVINNIPYIGIAMDTDRSRKNNIVISMLVKYDIATKTASRIKGLSTVDHLHDDTLDEVHRTFENRWEQILQEVVNNEFVVQEYEPSSFSFKKKVPAAERPLYRTYKLLRPLVIAKVEDAKPTKGFVRETIIGNLVTPPKQYLSLIDQLKESVWFSGLDDCHRGMPLDKPDLTFLPFDNFTILANYFHVANNSDPIILNVLRSSQGVEVYVYLKLGSDKRKSAFCLCYHFRLTTDYIMIPQKVYPKSDVYTGMSETEYRKNLRDFEPIVQDITKQVISKFLSTVFNYDGDRVSGSFKRDKTIARTAEPEYIPRNVHIVLDMSKRRESPMTFGGRMTGYHVKEHSRIAHVRKYKSGKVAHIGAMVINEGKGDQYGKVTKEYKL